MFPESTEFKSTRPPGSGDLPQDPTGHSYSGSAPLLDGASTTGTELIPASPRCPQEEIPTDSRPCASPAHFLASAGFLLNPIPEQAAAWRKMRAFRLVLADLLLARGIATAGEASSLSSILNLSISS